MLEQVWPLLTSQLRDELITQGVRSLKDDPTEYENFATVVASISKARPQSVKAQWKVGNNFGTKLAIAREPVAAAGFLAMTFMRVRKSELGALYLALGVEHKDLEVAEKSCGEGAPKQDGFARALANGIDGVSAGALACMLAVIADTGIEAWRKPAADALGHHLKTHHSFH